MQTLDSQSAPADSGHGGTRLEWTEDRTTVGGDELIFLKGGGGRPLLVLHEELGHGGTLLWHRALASERTLVLPLHPGFGRTPRAEWISSVRDLACFYGRFLRERKLAPIDVVGFSFGGWLAAEMAANDPGLFRRMVLVGAPGIRPPEGEIFDLFIPTAREYLQATVRDPESTAEFGSLFGVEQTAEQFEAWEEARAQVARLAWQPYLYDPSLPRLIDGLAVPTLLLWGADDRIVPVATGREYAKAIPASRLVIVPECGHRPEIEARETFLREVRDHLR